MLYETLVLSIGSLQSYWKFDEASGAPQDSKGSVAGTLVNAPTQGADSILAGGHGGKALTSSGSNQYVTFGDNYDFAGTDSFSVLVWVNPSGSLTSTRGIVAKTNSDSTDGWALRHNTSGVPQLVRWGDGGQESAGAARALEVGKTGMVVGTYDGGTIRCYLFQDAAATFNSTASTRSIAGNSESLRVGSRRDTTTGLAGTYDEVAIFDEALPIEMLWRLYLTGSRQLKAARIGF